MKNLVMGVAKGYSWYSLEAFITSCRKYCPDADLVLFVEDISKFTLNRLQLQKVQIFPIPEDLKSTIIVCSRFSMYKKFLDEHPKYQNIFVTDVSDVLFQDDIFARYSNYKDFLVYATEAKLIKDEPVNTNWIKRLFGEAEFNKIANNRIICAGTILGSRDTLQTFFKALNKRIKNNPRWGDDQSTFNYLVYNKLLPIENLIESNVETGDIFTVGIVQNPQIVNEKILRGDGKIPALVHQYNRHDILNQFVDNTCHDKNFRPEEKFFDFQSAFDQVFSLVQNQNWNIATKIFISYVFYVPNINLYPDKLLKLGELILRRYTPDAEILFLAVQKNLAGAFAVNININQMENLYRLYLQAEHLHVVNVQFKFFIRKRLISFVDNFYRNNQRDSALEYIRRLSIWRD